MRPIARWATSIDPALADAKLWETATGTGVVAAPATYEVDGKQYVSIADEGQQ